MSNRVGNTIHEIQKQICVSKLSSANDIAKIRMFTQISRLCLIVSKLTTSTETF